MRCGACAGRRCGIKASAIKGYPKPTQEHEQGGASAAWSWCGATVRAGPNAHRNNQRECAAGAVRSRCGATVRNKGLRSQKLIQTHKEAKSDGAEERFPQPKVTLNHTGARIWGGRQVRCGGTARRYGIKVAAAEGYSQTHTGANRGGGGEGGAELVQGDYAE